MCGIAGLLQRQHGDLAATMSRMLSALVRRGPDSAGTWNEPSARLILGHRRLAIIDLSPHGHQPMVSPSGRYVITFNGEIYNFAAIKAALPASYTFRGGSDTEVMLAAFDEWGVIESVRRFVGMFAFGLWDRRERTLTLSRDRLGEKPLYYGWSAAGFIFASELGAFEHHPLFDAVVDRGAVYDLLRYGYIPAPHSIYTGIYKLPPGTTLTLTERELANRPGEWSPDPDSPDHRVRPERYWALATIAAAPRADTKRSFDAVVEELKHHLDEAVKLQMIADVPLGAFLSGGIDSSVVVALMQARSSRPIKTFSIGFDDPRFDEANHAAAVAHYLGTEHTSVYISPDEARAVIPMLPSLYSEPLGDSSQIPTFLLAQVARQSVTVALSGDGGDELFGGYPWYARALGLWRRLAIIPTPLRDAVAHRIGGHSSDTLERYVAPFGASPSRFPRAAARIERAARLLAARTPRQLFEELRLTSPNVDRLVLSTDHVVSTPDTRHAEATQSPLEAMLYADTLTYLPDDILAKVDRAGMAVSLESRIPLLDHRIVEFVWSLPPLLRCGAPGTKTPLRNILYQHVPRHLVDRPKMGFSIPLAAWLRGPLRVWVEDLLAASDLQREGFLSPGAVQRTWREHLTGQRDNGDILWNIVTFQRWLVERRAPLNGETSLQDPVIHAQAF